MHSATCRCQYRDLAVGLSVMACVALAAVVILRRAMQDLGPQAPTEQQSRAAGYQDPQDSG